MLESLRLLKDPSEPAILCEFSCEREIQEKEEKTDQGLLGEEKKILDEHPRA